MNFIAAPPSYQPVVTDLKMTDDLFVKMHVVPVRGTHIPTHAHTFDHITLLAGGRVRLWVGDDMRGEFTAPCLINIEAHTAHRFETITDGVVYACIHALHGTADIEVDHEHHLDFVEF